MVVVGVDAVADRFAPAFGAEGADVFLPGDVDGLHKSLDEVGDGAGGFGFYFAADHGRDETGEGGAEIAGGKIIAGEKAGEISAEFFRGLRAGLLLGVVETEVGMVAGAGSAAKAAIGESE